MTGLYGRLVFDGVPLAIIIVAVMCAAITSQVVRFVVRATDGSWGEIWVPEHYSARGRWVPGYSFVEFHAKSYWCGALAFVGVLALFWLATRVTGTDRMLWFCRAVLESLGGLFDLVLATVGRWMRRG
jgi:hypothetical protein